MLTQLQGVAATAEGVYVSIVPFSCGDNLGKANYTATYLDWTEWEAAYMATWLANSSNKST